MPMLMLKCKTCGIIFSAVYISDMDKFKAESEEGLNLIYSCSRGHSNQYLVDNYIDLSWIYVYSLINSASSLKDDDVSISWL